MKKKGIKLGKRFKVNISNRTSYTLITLIVIILIGVIVYAVAPNPGHALEEIDWSNVIPQIKTDSLCLGADCKASWPEDSGGVESKAWISGAGWMENGEVWGCQASYPAGYFFKGAIRNNNGVIQIRMYISGYGAPSDSGWVRRHSVVGTGEWAAILDWEAGTLNAVACELDLLTKSLTFCGGGWACSLISSW